MKHSVETISDTKKMIRVEIPAERVKDEFEKLYSEVRQNAFIPGFRKGKIPRSIIKMRMGEDMATQIGFDLIKETLPGAMKSIPDQTIGYPEFNDWKVEEDQPFIYEATIQILPRIELNDYKGMEVPKPPLVVTEQDIAEGLDRIQASQTTLEVVKDRSADKGDRVYGRVSMSVDDNPLPGWTNRHIEVEIGKNTFFPGSAMEESFIGASIDTEHLFSIAFPEDYTYYRDVAGKTVAVRLLLNDIKIKNMPGIDDDLARDMGLENLEELKKMVRNDIEQRKKDEVDGAFETAIFDAIEAANTIPAPDEMVESEAEFMVENYFRFDGSLDDAKKSQLADSMKPMAVTRVKQRLILQRVAELEGIEALDEDVDKAFKEMAEQDGGSAEEIRKEWEEKDLLDNLRKQIIRSKALEFLKNNVVTVDAPVKEADDAEQNSDAEQE